MMPLHDVTLSLEVTQHIAHWHGCFESMYVGANLGGEPVTVLLCKRFKSARHANNAQRGIYEGYL
eukprot:SAG11_NODE_3163_length_2641_cov_8.683714_1_plen_65_part_00